jgi:hypothetical protein
MIELPEMCGVWTEEEDDALRGVTDAHVLERLDAKHGYNASALRKEFLQNWLQKAMDLSKARMA